MTPEQRDYELCDRAAQEYREKRPDVITFQCFNQEEADMLRGLMQRLYPDIPVYFSWLDFSRR